MKRYESLSELLIDYRELNGVSQTEFANSLNVDVRSVQRWEREETIIKSEKEDDIVSVTLLPYQLIRNLNAAIVIPTYYDFSIRKYSLTEMSNELPPASWFKLQFKNTTQNIRSIDYELDSQYLLKYLSFDKKVTNNLKQVIRKSIEILPEINLIITDDSGYYSGHSILFPITPAAFEKLKCREMTEEQLTIKDLITDQTMEVPCFYSYDVSADCNTNIYYTLHTIIQYFMNYNTVNYVYGSLTSRYDNYLVNEQFGLKIIWEEKVEDTKHKTAINRRFYQGDFKTFLSDI